VEVEENWKTKFYKLIPFSNPLEMPKPPGTITLLVLENSSRFNSMLPDLLLVLPLIRICWKNPGEIFSIISDVIIRVVSQAKNERSFHIFYQLLAGASAQEKKELFLRRPEEYNFINKSGAYSVKVDINLK
jgi:hypothetical protein